MKFSLIIISFLVLTNINAQDESCSTEFLGKFYVISEENTTEAVLIHSDICKRNNLAISDDRTGLSNIFHFKDSLLFENCESSADSLIWLYFFVNEYKFDSTKTRTSIPYSTSSRKRRKKEK
ncbi:hypothetical protein N9B82_01320 [Saprospiraceae bacterium]|nr:hypothetical protein [Saprospiraceae bacterium]